jgi:hypothetical protein
LLNTRSSARGISPPASVGHDHYPDTPSLRTRYPV